MRELMLALSAGSPEPLGVSLDEHGVNVAVFSRHATALEFCLFQGEVEVARIGLPERTGDIFHGHIAGVKAGARYGLRAHGPYEPRNGHRFNPNKLLVDPYALALDRPFILHESMFGYDRAAPDKDLSFSTVDSAPFTPKAVVVAPPKTELRPSFLRFQDTVLYETHVRGLTQTRADVPKRLRGTFGGLASAAMRKYFKALGVNCLELMPASTSIDERHLPPLGLKNYWGYNHVAFMVPAPHLAPNGWRDVRAATKSLSASGIEVLIDVVYNHSGEGDELGPTVSFRGLDNASYYRLRDDKRFYIDDMGCGNCLALERPHLVRLVIDSLRAWAEYGGVQGFRFDLAPAMGRLPAFSSAAPLIAAIDQDPILRQMKLIAEPWDIGPGGYQLGQFPAHWGEWNDKYRDCMRDFWRGNSVFADFALRFSGSADQFWHKRPSRSVNFITAHDGFTLADLVAYERKHNEANGEKNRDGISENRSWNHGVEGATTDEAILAARLQDQRNLLATLVLSHGTPMLSMGAEFGQSQGGNNNAYAQDNEISWANWGKADTRLLAFTQRLIALRRELRLYAADRFFTGVEQDGRVDVQWRDERGNEFIDLDWHDPGRQTLMVLLAVARGRVALLFNRGRLPVSIHLPEHGKAWHLRLSTSTPDGQGESDRTGEIGQRSVSVFTDF